MADTELLDRPAAPPAPTVTPFASLSAADRAALILHVQMDEEGYGREPITAWEAQRSIDHLTELGYARLWAEFAGRRV